MNLKLVVENLRFDLSDPKCELIIHESQYAFIQALEITSTGDEVIKRYWGKWNTDNPLQSIENILHQAMPWPDLPPLPQQTNNVTPFHNPTLLDAYEAIDRALYKAQQTLEPSKKRKAAEALLQAYQEGEIDSLNGGWL